MTVATSGFGVVRAAGTCDGSESVVRGSHCRRVLGAADAWVSVAATVKCEHKCAARGATVEVHVELAGCYLGC